jgi:hypothetical protein
MWILPKNYPLSSAFAQDMVASKEDLTLPRLNIVLAYVEIEAYATDSGQGVGNTFVTIADKLA